LRPANILALFAAIQILGGHWMALQSVAWLTMVIDYSKQTTLGVALEKTFDGAHPCSLCNTVSKGRSEERKDEAVKLVIKFEAVLTSDLLMPVATGTPRDFPELIQPQPVLAREPLTPPPLA
jgi:hypothetical protein